MTGAKFEYSSLIGQGSNHRSLMLVTSHVRSALCTLNWIFAVKTIQGRKLFKSRNYTGKYGIYLLSTAIWYNIKVQMLLEFLCMEELTQFGWGIKVYVQKPLEPSSGISHRYLLTAHQSGSVVMTSFEYFYLQIFRPS